MKQGTRVEVKNRFDGSWQPGFLLEVEETGDDGRATWRTVKRASDGMILPVPFPAGHVRLERARSRLPF